MKSSRVAGAALALVVAACGLGSDPTLNPPPDPMMVVRPPSLIIALGATDSLFAFVTGVATGADRTMNWSVGDTTIVHLTTLSPPDHALVTGRAAGTTAVTVAWRTDPNVRAISSITVH